MSLPIVDQIQNKFGLLHAALKPVGIESIDIAQCTGRVLAQDVVNFRDSPAMDLSAMDGYAFRWDDLLTEGEAEYPVNGVAPAGSSPLRLSSRESIRIFTGGVVPENADVVIPREQCLESGQRVAIKFPVAGLKRGWNIRRQGENCRIGSLSLGPQQFIDAPRLSSIVSMHGDVNLTVYKKVRVTVLNTGDELLGVGEPIEPWKIRDSNGPFLEAMLSRCPWIQWVRKTVRDNALDVQHALREAVDDSDAVLLTGGVSMGDTDHVPEAVTQCGGQIVFHRLPIRPGAPILGATTSRGQLIMGLPGNPVSVAVTFRRFAWQLLRRIGGADLRGAGAIRVPFLDTDPKTLHLQWFRLVKLDSEGGLVFVGNQGSGDVAALGLSDGFIEVPAGEPSNGNLLFYAWNSVC
jgi:molybdopterin molybdotransferase